MSIIERIKELLKEEFEEVKQEEYSHLSDICYFETGQKVICFKPKEKFPKVFGDNFSVSNEGELFIQSPQHNLSIWDSKDMEDLEEAIKESKRIKEKK